MPALFLFHLASRLTITVLATPAIPRSFDRFDPPSPEEASLALDSLLAAGALDAAALANSAATRGGGLRGAAAAAAEAAAGGGEGCLAELMQPAEALMWWVAQDTTFWVPLSAVLATCLLPP
jgi:hypothetical protein